MRFLGNAALIAGGVGLFSNALAAQSEAVYQNYAITTANLLVNKYYDGSTGQFDTLWWNSAITHTALADLSALLGGTSTVGSHDIFPMWDDLYTKHVGSTSVSNQNFLNPYYDDEGWWALFWIAAYDLTGISKYLSLAESIAADMHNTGQACGGGIWWSKSKSVVATIENVLLMSVAAHLANRVPGSADMYKGWADASWVFLQNSGEYNGNTFLLGGNTDTSTCKLVAGTNNIPSTYQQGVLIGALVELATAHKDGGYIDVAKSVAHVSITNSDFYNAQLGTMHEPLGGFDNDSAQFKGILARNLMILNRAHPDINYLNIITKSADSIWANARNADGTIIVLWDGNPSGNNLGSYSLEVSTSSAFECLIAAAEMVKGGTLGIVVD